MITKYYRTFFRNMSSQGHKDEYFVDEVDHRLFDSVEQIKELCEVMESAELGLFYLYLEESEAYDEDGFNLLSEMYPKPSSIFLVENSNGEEMLRIGINELQILEKEDYHKEKCDLFSDEGVE